MDTPLTPSDHRFLRRAVEIARKGWGRVHPNPMVGCLVVKDGEVIGEGWHQEVGGPHAEIHALAQAGEGARGSTIYVSLEPCNHVGRTPPCSLALMAAGVARVVYGAPDPGPESSGGGKALQDAGVRVAGPALSLPEARQENPAFFFNQERNQTFIALKLAQSLDGKIAEAPGRRTSITGPEARVETHRLRGGFDGVMVGSETVLVDDPLLTVREKVPFRKQPARVVLDTRARISPDAKLFRDLPEAPLIVFTGDDAPDSSVLSLEEAGATVHRVPKREGGVSLEAVLDVCWESGVRSLFCEGGGRLGSELIRAGMVGRMYLFVAPFVLGQGGVSAFPGLESRELWREWRPAASSLTFGRDSLLIFDRVD